MPPRKICLKAYHLRCSLGPEAFSASQKADGFQKIGNSNIFGGFGTPAGIEHPGSKTGILSFGNFSALKDLFQFLFGDVLKT